MEAQRTPRALRRPKDRREKVSEGVCVCVCVQRYKSSIPRRMAWMVGRSVAWVGLSVCDHLTEIFDLRDFCRFHPSIHPPEARGKANPFCQNDVTFSAHVKPGRERGVKKTDVSQRGGGEREGDDAGWRLERERERREVEESFRPFGKLVAAGGRRDRKGAPASQPKKEKRCERWWCGDRASAGDTSVVTCVENATQTETILKTQFVKVAIHV